MHDPMTQVFQIKYPWKKYSKSKQKGFLSDYREPLITVWHVDPCRDGSDDSCGRFKRARHGSKDVLAKIEKRYEFDWDNVFKSEEDGRVYYRGMFYPENAGLGMPNMTVNSIALNLMFLAALEYFGSRKKASTFCQKHLFEVFMFAENPTDSLRDSIARTWGTNDSRKTRIHEMASVIYGWILRQDTPWYKHPRWHINHWKIQIHPIEAFKRWAFTRCCKCGNGFKWGQSCCTDQWDSDGPSWFGEKGVYHDSCSDISQKPAKET